MSASHSVTQLLEQWNNGDRSALDKLMPLIYAELRKMARRYMRQQNPDHTLQTTAVLEVSPNTVMRDWRMAKIWLHRALSQASKV